MAFTVLQIDKICRTCLSDNGDMKSIFSLDETLGENARIFEMLMSCASVQVLSDYFYKLDTFNMSRAIPFFKCFLLPYNPSAFCFRLGLSSTISYYFLSDQIFFIRS